MDVSENVEVVLACRVSPKQKADIVRMIRGKYPNKTTLAIGDGANDVAMILAAHVGVGILGKEGQQAARSADYAIGQFKFLKPLLFFHGREAYRRNSYFILYNFYKNFLYVTTQFYFGFQSAFSGQPLYEQVIYQLYNLTMTAAPIMWYSTYDYEFEKDQETQKMKYGDKSEKIEVDDHAIQNTQYNDDDSDSATEKYFLANPELYSIGLDGDCFSLLLFAEWIFYALFHSFIVFATSYYALTFFQVSQNDGKEIGLFVAGMTVYGVCIFIANFILGCNAKTYEWRGIFLLFLGPISYFFFYWLLNLIFIGDIKSSFIPNFSINLVYIVIFFCLATVYVIEKVFSTYHKMKKNMINGDMCCVKDNTAARF